MGLLNSQANAQALQAAPQQAGGQPPAVPAMTQASHADRSPTSNGQYHDQAHEVLRQHLQSLPPQQKQFIQAYLVPETLTLMGIIVGAEVYDFLKPFVDPAKMAVIVPRNQSAQAGQAPAPLLNQGQTNTPQAQPQSAPASGQGGTQAPQPQAPVSQ